MKRTLTLLIASLLAPPGSLHAADFILADQSRAIAPRRSSFSRTRRRARAMRR